MKLYEIKAEIEALIDPETGEIADFSKFEALNMERDTKIENVACWFKNTVAEAKAIREEEKALAERRQKLERRADGLKDFLGRTLNGEKFSTAKCAISFRKTTSTNVVDPLAVIQWAKTTKHGDCIKWKDPDIDKTEVAKLLKGGVEVPGVELVNGLSMGVK